MRNTQELCLYNDSKRCVDIFNNMQLYKRRAWMAKGKKPVRHHDVWEEILLLSRHRRMPVSMTHVYGHNKLVYNDAADDLAKGGAARSTVHRILWPKGPPEGEPRATRQKHMRAQGVKRQAAVQASESDTCSDRSIAICHRRRQMRNAMMDIPDLEPN